MFKDTLLSIIFLIIEIIGVFLLTIEVFGKMNPDNMIISAIIIGIGMVGNCIFTIIRAVREAKRK